MAKDWTGNENSIFNTLGVSLKNSVRAENDYYATEPKALEELLKYEKFENVWECACGEGHLSEVLKKHNIHGRSSDLINRGYGEVEDFLRSDVKEYDGDIVTNPPFKFATEFVINALRTVKENRKVAMLCRVQFIEGNQRYIKIFDKYPPQTIYTPVKRLNCARNGEFAKFKTNSHNAMMFAWFVWQKGNFNETKLKWINY